DYYCQVYDTSGNVLF
nr:immunoglobulin light chain junction region [Macaca mulatta]